VFDFTSGIPQIIIGLLIAACVFLALQWYRAERQVRIWTGPWPTVTLLAYRQVLKEALDRFPGEVTETHVTFTFKRLIALLQLNDAVISDIVADRARLEHGIADDVLTVNHVLTEIADPAVDDVAGERELGWRDHATQAVVQSTHRARGLRKLQVTETAWNRVQA
jgi:hypothetical protein